MSATDVRSLLEAIGGESGCKRLALDFYARVATNHELKPLFPGKSLRCATEEFAAFLIQFLDGNVDQTQYRWWLSLRESHSRFRISDRQRLAWLGLMGDALDCQVEDAETRLNLKRFVNVASAYLVGNDPGEMEHQELNWRWAQQLALDQLIDLIANGSDTEAIALSQQFSSRPGVFVGILARMIETGREPLVQFALECIQRDHKLQDCRFNGRTLLHYASGSSCLPIVRSLLSAGVDPDILDSGGHTPLYRVAGSRENEIGDEIVTALVQAGAKVDHCGGVSRSTALHQAARFGDLQVAMALLNAGASKSARDKRGLTPLDRAVNCRRRNLVALLAP